MSVKNLITELNDSFVEREKEIKMIIASMIAGEHILLLGPPGTAKSMLARAVSGAFGMSYFEKLMSGTTTPEEVFGPFDLPKLRSHGIMVRNTSGYAPEKEVCFFDEVYKCNSATLNGLLKLLNERIFEDAGQQIKVPLKMAILASNELPQDASLRAFADRIAVRMVVSYVSDAGAPKMMFSEPKNPTTQVSAQEYLDLCTARQMCAITQEVEDTFVGLRCSLRKDKGIEASDRRWRQAIKVVQAWAVLDGRNEICGDDLLDVLPDVLWRTPSDRPTLIAEIGRLASPESLKITEMVDAAIELVSLKGVNMANQGDVVSATANARQQLGVILKTIEALPASPRRDQASERVKGLIADTIASLQKRLSAIQR